MWRWRTCAIAVERMVGFGGETKTKGELPYTPRTKKVLQLAVARGARHAAAAGPARSICCWRCCVRARGVAAQVLQSLNVRLDEVLDGIRRCLDGDSEEGEEGPFGGGGEESSNEAAAGYA